MNRSVGDSNEHKLMRIISPSCHTLFGSTSVVGILLDTAPHTTSSSYTFTSYVALQRHLFHLSGSGSKCLASCWKAIRMPALCLICLHQARAANVCRASLHNAGRFSWMHFTSCQDIGTVLRRYRLCEGQCSNSLFSLHLSPAHQLTMVRARWWYSS